MLDMNWFEIVSVLGVGAILSRLLDIFWLERIRDGREHRKWLRDQRLSAYVDLTKDLLSLGTSRGGAKADSILEGYAVASRAILLSHDEDLKARIDSFLTRLASHKLLHDQGKQAEAHAILKEVEDLGDDIVRSLRTSLAQK